MLKRQSALNFTQKQKPNVSDKPLSRHKNRQLKPPKKRDLRQRNQKVLPSCLSSRKKQLPLTQATHLDGDAGGVKASRAVMRNARIKHATLR